MKGLLLIILLSIGAIGSAQSTPDIIVRDFFGTFSSGNVEGAIDDLYAKNPWMARRSEEIANLKRQLKGAVEIMGKYYGYSMLGTKDLQSDLVAMDYMVKYDRQPMRFRFMFYRPNKEWILYSFSFDDSMDGEPQDLLRGTYLHP